MTTTWLGKTLTLDCPHCLKIVTVGFRGQIHGNVTVLDSGAPAAPSKRSLSMKKVRPGYQKVLDALQVGESIIITPNRFAWFGWSAGPWGKRHPHVVLVEEKQEDGSVKITRGEDKL